MMEGGRGRPSLDTFFELARVLGVDPAELYHGVRPDLIPTAISGCYVSRRSAAEIEAGMERTP
jgi:transcriptional regulator with XRE-family HTH domain